jgi:hypothetical protein
MTHNGLEQSTHSEQDEITERISYIYIYKEDVCLSVCLFFMQLVPVIASVTKLSIALLGVQRKVERGLSRPRRWERGLGEISLNFDEL